MRKHESKTAHRGSYDAKSDGEIRSSSSSSAELAGKEVRSPATITEPPSRAATVTLSGGVLMIAADNSELSQILHDLTAIGGTTIDGPVKSARVYGVYGPRSPRDVLTDLLAGLGYNFLMVGLTAQGAPRRLVLSISNDATGPAPPSSPAANAPEAEADIPDEEQPGPGGVLHVPPPPPEDLHQRVEQNLQRLQQMQDQLKQQEPPQ